MTKDPFDGIEKGHYGLIVADPPWVFSNFSKKGEKKNPNQHYNCMALDEIEALPVKTLAAKDCALILWATAPMLPQAIRTMSAWDFQYKTSGAWAKQSKTGEKWAFGTGYCFRSAAEFFILGTRGKPKPMSRSIRNLVVAPVREHSRKPEQFMEAIESLYDGPRLELFSRSNRDGWDAWGNQTGLFNGGECDRQAE